MKIVILGGGESGIGAAYLAKSKGMDVFLSDKGKIKDHYKKQLIDFGIEFEEENHDEERILNADWVVKSPGIPKKADLIQKIIHKKIAFSDRYIKELENTYNLTFDDAYSILFETHHKEILLHKKPFSKLKKDIFDDVNIKSS